MSGWRTEIEEALEDFRTVADLARSPITASELAVEFLDAPHKPPARLPPGKMAVYGFWYAGGWLKIGMAGPKSQARYVSQHYNVGSAISTLAGSLAKDQRMGGVPDFAPAVPGDWIKSRTSRVNILLPSQCGVLLLALLEAFLHVRLRPRYER